LCFDGVEIINGKEPLDSIKTENVLTS
jgi:hypothetical protein